MAARNDGGYGPVAWAGSDGTYHPPMNPPVAPASITVTPSEDNEGTKVSWTAPAKGDAPTSYQIAYWDIDVAQFQYIDHSSTTDLEAVIDVAPADLRTVAVRGHLGVVAYKDRGVWGSWAVGWHASATPSRLDMITQSSSLGLSLTYADGGTAGKKIDFKEDPNLMCPRLGGLYVDTADNTAWIADPCSKWVHAFDIGSEDGTLTHNLDTSLTTDELYPPEGIGRLNPMYTPWTLWSDGEILWVAERDVGMLLPYRLSDGEFIPDRRFIMAPIKPQFGHSFLAPAAVWSDSKTVWVADAMIDQLIFAVKLEPERWLTFSPDLFVPSAFDNCYIPEKPRVSDVMPSATCTNETALRDALLDKRRDSPVGAYSDGRWLWIAVDYFKDPSKAGQLLAFNLLSGERAADRDTILHCDIRNPIGMWSDGENLWVVDGATKRLYTFAIPAQTAQQQAANSPVQGSVTIAGTAQVGETLTADTSGITDPDGLDNATFTYQWLAGDVDISGATSASYTLTDSEEGKAVKVTASLTDDAGNEESLTSAATASVAAATEVGTLAGFTLVDTSNQSEVATLTEGAALTIDDPASGSYGIRVAVATGAEVGSVRLELSGEKSVSKTENMAPYSLYGDDGTNLNGESLPVGSYTLRAAPYSENNLGDDELQALEISFSVAKANSPATGVPAISGTLQVGQTLTANTSGITDPDGLDNATFTYQWLADDVDISGATGDSYTLTDSEEGKAIRVRVSFADDAGNDEALTSNGTQAVAARPLRLDDFDAGDGQEVLASALIQVGNQGRKNNENQDRSWYATETSAWHASGELRDGSLAWNDMTVTRVVYFPANGEFRFNEADSVHIGDSFAAGAGNHEATIWVQTETETVSFQAKDHIMNSGSGWINFKAPSSIRSVLEGVSEGELIIIAVSAPKES